MKLVKHSKKNIKLSNYIKLGLLFIVVIFLVIILRNIYLNKEANTLNIPVIRSAITQEIRSNELYSYLNENQDSLIYIGISSDSKCRTFEKSIKSYIESNDLGDVVIYLNLENEDYTKEFFYNFNNTYKSEKGVNSYPSFVYFKNGEIKDILSGDLNLTLFKEFLFYNGVIK